MLGLMLGIIVACGTARWDVKTMTDSAAYRVVLEPRESRVASLIDVPAPAWSPRSGRFQDSPEAQVWRVRGWLIGAKLEADGDVHAVIGDAEVVSLGTRGQAKTITMVVEFPGPECTKGSRLEAQIAEARQQILTLFPGLGRRFRKPKHSILVSVEGVGFFDDPHGQTGGAPNGIELHPVLSIRGSE